MIKISEESLALSDNAKKIKLQILGEGVKIKYFLDETIEGKAKSEPPDKITKIAKITFKNKEAMADNTICHELLHLYLFVVKGYPQINSGWEDYKLAIIILDNIFSHIIMAPYLQKLNYFNDFIETEKLATKKLIVSFKNKIEENSLLMDFKTLSIVLCVRATNVGFTVEEVKQFEEYLRKTKNSDSEILYDEKIIKAISDNLPQSNYGINYYEQLLRRCVQELNLTNDVNFEYFKKNLNPY